GPRSRRRTRWSGRSARRARRWRHPESAPRAGKASRCRIYGPPREQRLGQLQVSGSSAGGASLSRALRRYSDGGTPTWFRKKRVKLLCAEKPSSAETSEILPSPEDRREIAVSTHSMSRYARGEKPVHSWNRS